MDNLRERIDEVFRQHPAGECSGYRAPPPNYPGRSVAWIADRTGAHWRSVYDWCAGQHAPPRLFLVALERLEREATERAAG